MRKGNENLSNLKILAEKLCDLQDDGADYSFSCRVRGRNDIPTNRMPLKIRRGQLNNLGARPKCISTIITTDDYLTDGYRIIYDAKDEVFNQPRFLSRFAHTI